MPRPLFSSLHYVMYELFLTTFNLKFPVITRLIFMDLIFLGHIFSQKINENTLVKYFIVHKHIKTECQYIIRKQLKTIFKMWKKACPIPVEICC